MLLNIQSYIYTLNRFRRDLIWRFVYFQWFLHCNLLIFFPNLASVSFSLSLSLSLDRHVGLLDWFMLGMKWNSHYMHHTQWNMNQWTRSQDATHWSRCQSIHSQLIHRTLQSPESMLLKTFKENWKKKQSRERERERNATRETRQSKWNPIATRVGSAPSGSRSY